jgi:hypothetical protein
MKNLYIGKESKGMRRNAGQLIRQVTMIKATNGIARQIVFYQISGSYGGEYEV